MIRVIPSIIAHNQRELDERFRRVSKLTDYFQLDVMDGSFVKDKTFDFKFALSKNKHFEAHLMVRNPFMWCTEHFDQFETFIIHAETLGFSLFRSPLKEFVERAHAHKKRVGIAINPETAIRDIRKYVPLVDKVLVMTVHPGSYGSPFVMNTLLKVRELLRVFPKTIVQVDGGITPETAFLCKKEGVSEFVVGSYLQTKQSSTAWNELLNNLK